MPDNAGTQFSCPMNLADADTLFMFIVDCVL